MPDPLRKVNPGDEFVIPADTYNAFIDAANAAKGVGRIGNRDRSGFALDAALVEVKNASGADVGPCGVLGISGVLIPAIDATTRTQLKYAWCLTGVTPTIADHTGKFAIATTPIKNGEIGLCVVAGLWPVNLEITATSDQFADVKASSAELKTGGTGSAQIIWKEPGTGSGKLGLVRLGNLTGPPGLMQLTQTGGALGVDSFSLSSWTYDLRWPGADPSSTVATGLSPEVRTLPTWTDAAAWGYAAYFSGAWHLIEALEPIHDVEKCDPAEFDDGSGDEGGDSA